MKRLGSIVIIVMLLIAGCAALPSVFTDLSYLKTTADGVSYVVTRKTTTDHLLSVAMDKDCAVLRVIQGQEICQNDKKIVFHSPVLKDSHVTTVESKVVPADGITAPPNPEIESEKSSAF